MCIITAGSLDVDIPTNCKGVGGRSRELALSAALELDALKRSCSSSLWYKDVEIAFLCMATDGVDGPDQEVAGGLFFKAQPIYLLILFLPSFLS